MEAGPAGSPHPVRVLWAVPRSASTAFERMVIERGDHHVLDEPFSAAYYHGPERRSPRFALSEPDATVARIVAVITARADEGPIFVKDMAYHPGPRLGPEVLGPWHHAFLIRDPRWTVPSMARIWPDLTAEEVGFEAMARTVESLDEAGDDPFVIDSDDLCRYPGAVVAAWCDAMGVDPDPDALTWEPGMCPEWKRWPDWYRAAALSRGFAPPATGSPPHVADPRLAALIEAARPQYEALRARRWVP